jgi:hypothetical protein
MRRKPTARGFGSGSAMASVADLSLQPSDYGKWRAKPYREFGYHHLRRFAAKLNGLSVYTRLQSPEHRGRFSATRMFLRVSGGGRFAPGPGVIILPLARLSALRRLYARLHLAGAISGSFS